MLNIKKFVLHQLTPLLSVACIIAANAEAGNKQPRKNAPYIRVDVGYSYVPRNLNAEFYAKKPDGAFVGTVGSGYTINSKFRMDASASYRGDYRYAAIDTTTSIRESQRLSSLALMVSGYWSPMGERCIRSSPYLMAGAGIAINKAEDFVGGQVRVFGDQKRNFAWQVGAGLLCKASNYINADLLYKYVDLGTVRTKYVGMDGSALKSIPGGIRGRLRAHEITIGIHYKF